MLTREECYNILGVSIDSSKEDIKKAYRKKARKYHPDVNQGNAEAEKKFKEISQAYRILTDENGSNHGGFNPFGQDWGDLFQNIFFNRGHQSRNLSNSSIKTFFTIKMKDFLTGGKFDVNFERMLYCDNCNGIGGEKSTCENCDGTGMLFQHQSHSSIGISCNRCNGTGEMITDRCSHCNGRGVRKERVYKELDLKPGFNAKTLVYHEEGNVENKGIPPGDLIIIPNVSYNSNTPIEVNDNNIFLTSLKIDPIYFMVGGEIDVALPTEEEISINISPNTNFGSTIRIGGYGLPHQYGDASNRGDVNIRLIPEIPQSINEKYIDMFKEYLNDRYERA